MINIQIVKEQYLRMSDDQLISFAENESHKLTIESFYLLKSEFEERNLDLSVIEAAEIDKSLNELNKQSVFEETTTITFINTIWQYAFDEKEKDKSNNDICKGIIKKGVEEQYAFMIVQSLESKSKEIIAGCENEIIGSWGILAVGIIIVYLISNSTVSGYFALWGIIAIVGAVLRLYKSYSTKQKYQAIYNNIINELDETDKVDVSQN